MVEETHRALYQAVGARIRKRRDELGITQQSLGEQVGLSRTSVTNVEQGRQAILLHQLVQFARALGAEPSTFLPAVQAPQSSHLPSEIAHLIKRLKASPSRRQRPKA
jgi:transcriptional regulator with XRE-family HTH domain